MGFVFDTTQKFLEVFLKDCRGPRNNFYSFRRENTGDIT